MATSPSSPDKPPSNPEAVAAFAFIIAVIALIVSASRHPTIPKPAVTDADKKKLEADESAERIRLRAEQECEEARIRQQEAIAQATRETELMREQMEHAQQEFALLAQEECERSQRIREDAQREMREDVERAHQEADEHRRRAEEATNLACITTEELQKAKDAKEDAERRLKQGIQPIIMPTPDELATTRQRVQYQDHLFHFAIVGVSGSGKSSLVNSFRGLRSRDEGAAAVGVTETTLEITRYPDHADKRIVWYDIPGAGTLNCHDWQYFNHQGLYVFDCIVVVVDNRFMLMDVAILTNAQRFKIPIFIVRSKADQHIENIMKEMVYDNEAEDEEAVRRRLYKPARDQFVEETRNSVRKNLEDANLPEQQVYIVSSSALRNIVRSKMPNKMIDELALVGDMLSQAHKKCGGQSSGV